jgi:threonine dehydratase
MTGPHREFSPAEIRAAHAVISPHLHRTPVLTCASLDALVGARLFFKAENFQRTGSFKARGAMHAVLTLPDEAAARGVITHSSGNHGAALAYAARRRGIPATIIMPRDSARLKLANVAAWGGQVVLCEPTLAARERTAADHQAASGATFIHPYDDFAVMAGQGTAALELLAEVPDLDVLTCPVGGGGLLAGTAVAAHGHRADLRVIAAEPAAADDAARSFRAGTRQPASPGPTLADGLRTTLGERNFTVMQRHVADVVTVDEADIVAAMRLVWERLKIIIEPSCAVPVAALLTGQVPAIAGGRVGVILTGGNVDLDRLPWQSAS